MARHLSIVLGLAAAVAMPIATGARAAEPNAAKNLAVLCKIFQRTYDTDLKRRGEANSLILAQCPGQGGVFRPFGGYAVLGRLAKNADHPEPAALAKFGAGGAKVYQLLKARGASIETVDLMVGTPEFAAAAQLYNGAFTKQAAEAKTNPRFDPFARK